MLYDRPSETLSHRWLFGRLPAIASLFVAAIVAASAGLPQVRIGSWTGLFGVAAQRMFGVSFACIVTFTILHSLMPSKNRVDPDRLLVRISLAALWWTPLCLFIQQNSIWTLSAMAAFTIVVVGIFSSLQDDPNRASAESLSEQDLQLFRFQPLVRPYLSICAAVCAQIGVLAAFAGRSFIAALLVALAFSIWSSSFGFYGGWQDQQGSRGSKFQSQRMLSAALSIVLTVVALFPYLRRTHGWAGSHGRSPWHASSGTRMSGTLRAQSVEEPVMGSSAGNTGIVLWPEKQTVTKLVMPPPMQESLSLTNFHTTDPLIVPFNGVYWFFKAPDLQPPVNSRQAHASPDAVEIRSTDGRPLSIEAYDHLATLIDLDCCSRIQIAIRNTDRYPETVSLELVLINTSLPGKPIQSLGKEMVRSTPPREIYEKPKPATETLNFAIPARPSLRRFDEMKVVFRLDRARADAGARIAIDHFVLVPRGL